jgi:hypothetical protein
MSPKVFQNILPMQTPQEFYVIERVFAYVSKTIVQILLPLNPEIIFSLFFIKAAVAPLKFML